MDDLDVEGVMNLWVGGHLRGVRRGWRMVRGEIEADAVVGRPRGESYTRERRRGRGGQGPWVRHRTPRRETGGSVTDRSIPNHRPGLFLLPFVFTEESQDTRQTEGTRPGVRGTPVLSWAVRVVTGHGLLHGTSCQSP